MQPAWRRNLGHALRRWRRAFKAALPYVRRREYAKVLRKYELLTTSLGMGLRRADEAQLVARKPCRTRLTGDVCVFLSYQPGPALKPHVATHVEHLLAQGITVVLVLNTPLPAEAVILDPQLEERLAAVYVRENTGFDFAGWAHVHAVLAPLLDPMRLFLVNDSIVGPLDAASFAAVIGRIRASGADVIGLTEALAPTRHLQSFFLVFARRALPELASFFADVLCFDDKGTVIDVYETQLTLRAQRAGLSCEALFPALSDDPWASNDTFFRWPELIRAGFPYIKTSVLAEQADDPELKELVPARFRP
jgi:lipopolysaccharide biosynthesis protein